MIFYDIYAFLSIGSCCTKCLYASYKYKLNWTIANCCDWIKGWVGENWREVWCDCGGRTRSNWGRPLQWSLHQTILWASHKTSPQRQWHLCHSSKSYIIEITFPNVNDHIWIWLVIKFMLQCAYDTGWSSRNAFSQGYLHLNIQHCKTCVQMYALLIKSFSFRFSKLMSSKVSHWYLYITFCRCVCVHSSCAILCGFMWMGCGK